MNRYRMKEDEIIEQLHTMASGFSEIRSGDAGEHNDENE